MLRRSIVALLLAAPVVVFVQITRQRRQVWKTKQVTKTWSNKEFAQQRPILLPEAANLLRRSVPLITSNYYNSTEAAYVDSGAEEEKCSCMKENQCCVVYKTHKFGFALVSILLQPYWGTIKQAEPHRPPSIPKTDFRHVIVLRNIYSALVSGYLYHKSGRECWLSSSGTEWREGTKFGMYQINWDTYVGYELQPPKGNRTTMCHYIVEEPEDIGMRAYIGWVFEVYYKAIFTLWAEARNLTRVAEKTRFVCFEDLTSPNRDAETSAGLLDFLLGSSSGNRTNKKPTSLRFDRGHATSHDPALRNHLKEVIDELDARYYNGELAWLNSVLPC